MNSILKTLTVENRFGIGSGQSYSPYEEVSATSTASVCMMNIGLMNAFCSALFFIVASGTRLNLYRNCI